jgi:hypothetical protein
MSPFLARYLMYSTNMRILNFKELQRFRGPSGKKLQKVNQNETRCELKTVNVFGGSYAFDTVIRYLCPIGN